MNDEFERGRRLQAQHLAAGYAERRDRRERIATAALQGLLAYYGDSIPREAVTYSVEAADALIAELDKPKEVNP